MCQLVRLDQIEVVEKGEKNLPYLHLLPTIWDDNDRTCSETKEQRIETTCMYDEPKGRMITYFVRIRMEKIYNKDDQKLRTEHDWSIWLVPYGFVRT